MPVLVSAKVKVKSCLLSRSKSSGKAFNYIYLVLGYPVLWCLAEHSLSWTRVSPVFLFTSSDADMLKNILICHQVSGWYLWTVRLLPSRLINFTFEHISTVTEATYWKGQFCLDGKLPTHLSDKIIMFTFYELHPEVYTCTSYWWYWCPHLCFSVWIDVFLIKYPPGAVHINFETRL